MLLRHSHPLIPELLADERGGGALMAKLGLSRKEPQPASGKLRLILLALLLLLVCLAGVYLGVTYRD